MAERKRNQPKVAGLLVSLTDLEKVQAAEKVAATMATPGWAFIVGLLEMRETQLVEGLVHGSPERSQAEYAADAGEARGIRWALDAGPNVLNVAEAAAKELTRAEGAS